MDFQRSATIGSLNNVGDSPACCGQLDQLEHVTEFGPFIQSALRFMPQCSVTAGLRYDWVTSRSTTVFQ